MSVIDPTPCNEGLLAEMAALAQQIENPIAPYPKFFSAPECGASLGGGSFPQYYFPMTCPDSGVPNYKDNCMRVTTLDPLKNIVTSTELVNFLPGATEGFNIFQNLDNILTSFYVPPNYAMTFFKTNPVGAAVGSIPYARFQPGSLVVNTCVQQLTLTDGSFLTSGDSSGCTAHNAPYLVITEVEEFGNMIVEMCKDSRPIQLGTALNSLNTTWKPQTAGCDNYMTAVCNMSNTVDTEFNAACSCYRQKITLDNTYGEALNVPVCCFGKDPSGDISKSCAFNVEAYKTSEMAKNCCSFAECQQVVNRSTDMQQNTATPGKIECNGDFIEFPIPKKKPEVSPGQNSYTEKNSYIPSYIWIILAVAAVTILGFLINIAFV